MAEQRASSGNQEEKEFMNSFGRILEEGAGNSGGLQCWCEVVQGENEEGQSPIGTQFGNYGKRQ